jgi:uncharacterized protein YwqG
MTAGLVVLALFGLLLGAVVVSAAIRMFRTAVGRRPVNAVARPDLLRLLRDALPQPAADSLAGLIRPSILMTLTSTPRGGLTPGRSRVGGPPDLPPGVDWPQRDGKPMRFLAQINCHEPTPWDVDLLLPDVGMLQFFYDAERAPAGFSPGDRDSWRVVYSETIPIPSTPPPAPAAPTDGSEYHCCEVAFSADATLPPWDSLDTDALGLEAEQVDAYLEVLDALGRRRGPIINRMLGHPDPVQDGRMALQCQLVCGGLDLAHPAGWKDPRVRQLADGAADWMLLLQLDSNFDMKWGEPGRLYFYIRRRDLLELRFENVWMIRQSG